MNRRFFLYGLGAMNEIPIDLLERLARERADIELDPSPQTFAVSRQLFEVLKAHGATSPAV